MQVTRLWANEQPFGAEIAEITLEGGRLLASGSGLGSDPVPYRLEYELTTIENYVTARLAVSTRGAGWRRGLVLERAASGEWSCSTDSVGEQDWPPPGGDMATVAAALDCDLGKSPLTNSMPVLRHGLHHEGGPLDFLMAWVAVPALAVSASPQRYTFVRRAPGAATVRYASLDSTFVADITFDDLGLVVDYPGIGHVVSGPIA